MFLLRPYPSSSLPRLLYRTISTSAQVLPRLRTDLKTALQTKDQTRLSVLRGLLADITNASKTDKPIATDGALFILLNKRIAASEGAVEGFQMAKREDLVGKEEEQIKVLKEYLGGIEVMEDEELQKVLNKEIEGFSERGEKLQKGKLMGMVLKAVGDRAVEKGLLSKMVKEAAKENKAAGGNA